MGTRLGSSSKIQTDRKPECAQLEVKLRWRWSQDMEAPLKLKDIAVSQPRILMAGDPFTLSCCHMSGIWLLDSTVI